MHAPLRSCLLLAVLGALPAVEPPAADPRPAADESAAVATLRAFIFPAQIQYQSGGYRDADGDGRGSFAPCLRDLASGPLPRGRATLSLLPPAFDAEQPCVGGYGFATYSFGETGFVAYAWPQTQPQSQPQRQRQRQRHQLRAGAAAGTSVYALMANGTLWRRAIAIEQVEPAPWDLWGGGKPQDPVQNPAPPWVRHQPPPASGPARPPSRTMADNLRQVALGALAYAQDNDRRFPSDLDTLAKLVDLPGKVLRSQKAPDRVDALLYVRPTPDARATQPLVLEDPACWDGKGGHLVFCDGHTGWLAGPAAAKVWAEGRRLAALPSASTTGIAPAEWAAVQKLLDAAKPAKQEPPGAGAPDPDGVPDPEF